jgi:transcription antitermination factor NusG
MDLRNSDYARQLVHEAHEREAVRQAAIWSRPAGQEHWYLAREGRRFREESANGLFSDYGVECYTPRLRKMVRIPLNRMSQRQRRLGIAQREAKLVPLFPTYRLIRFDLRRNDWRELFERAGIHGMICLDEYGRALPMPVQDMEIDKLRAKEVDGAIPETMTVIDLGWEVGEQARIKEGPYIGYRGVVHDLPEIKVSDLDSEARCRLAMHIFGRVVLVEIPLHHLEKLDSR